MDNVQFRKINCLKDGSKTATGQQVDNVILEEILDYTTKQTDYQAKRDAYKN